MANPKHILDALSKGYFVVVKKDDEYMQITPLKYDSYSFVASDWFESVLYAKKDFNNILYVSYIKNDPKNVTIEEIYLPEYERFKVGDKVKIIQTGEAGRVVSKGLYLYKINYSGKYQADYAHNELIPHYEDDTIELTHAEIAKKLDIDPDKLKIKE